MYNPGGYQNPVKIYESSNSQVYRAYDEENIRYVILKRLNKTYPTTEEISKFYREYELTGMFSNDGIIQVYGLTKKDNSPAIIMEDIGGRSLADIIKSGKLTITEFLNLSLNIIDIIGNIHKRNIIHKDINPSNIIWNRETGELRIIDFGIATELTRELTSVKNPNVLEGTIAFISPEQTGRMNRSLDYRTDFYSLGVTFYLMLTGHLPFESKDLLKLVHSHMAVQPATPHEVDENIPVVLSRIVMKLMAKNAEDRYINTRGIKADLERCRRELIDIGSMGNFQLGLHDISDKFQIPQKIYGREDEIAELLSAFERVSDGSSELMLVSGFSGIGKSVLINEIQKPIVRHRGYFISGKFEKLKKDVPYSGIIQAFNGLARQILAENKAETAQWKEKILNALGPNCRIVTDIIPLFELITGRQPDVPILGAVESQNRFRHVFQEFIKVLASREHPLAVFLDDLQWADLASLHLLKLFTTDSDIRHIFMIGAYRNNETSDSHPLILSIDEIKKAGTAVNTIFLKPLNPEHAVQLLDDTLRRTEDETGYLAELLIRKTGGNPFFLNEFLNFLYKKSLIEFSFKRGWSWDITGIEELQVTDNVVDLMVSKIKALPGNSQEVLKIGACMGSYFTLSALITVCGKPEEEILPAIKLVQEEGILNRIDDIYRFGHDRILEAAYSLVSDEEKIRQHYRIGILELINTDKEKLHDKIFYIVNHLNAGAAMITNESERDELVELNLSAGKKALMSNAYESALNYFKAGILFLGEACWEKNYRLTLEIYQEAAVSAQLSAEYDTMNNMSGEVIENASTILDKIKVYDSRISACIARNQLTEGVKIGLSVLKMLGLNLPDKPGKLKIIRELISLKIFLKGKPVANLVNLPGMKDPHKLAIMQILTGIGTSAYYTAPELLPLVIFNAVRLSVKYGNSIYSPYTYAGFGIILCGALGEIDRGYEYGKLALKLVEKFNITETKSRVWFVVWFVINHWKRPFRDSFKPLLEGYKIGLETGDLEFSALAASTYTNNLLFSGRELAGVEKEMEKYADAIGKFNQDIILTQQMIYQHYVQTLRGSTVDYSKFITFLYDPNKMNPDNEKANDISTFFFVYFYLLNFNYLVENYKEALMHAEQIRPYVDDLVSSPYVPIFYFCESLTLIALCSIEKRTVQKKYLKRVIQNQKKMKKWASHAPMNYSHKYHLVEAEIARIQKNEFKAREHYKLAVKLSRNNRFLNEEALSLKLFAKFWKEIDEEKIAALYMSEALHAYKMWGASAVADDIEKRYGYLLQLHKDDLKSSSGKSGSDTSSSSTSEFIDIATVIKTAQALSSEIDLGRLLEAIIKFAIENAGAQRGFLIMEDEDDGNLYIEAVGEPDEESGVVDSIPVDNNPDLSSAVVHYVHRTGENVVLDDAHKEGMFSNDPYIKEKKIKSLLCFPIKYKGKSSGILYLENNLTSNVFTRDRLELLRILSAQAAISVENARLLIHRENKAKLEKEIEMAEGIQRSLLPENVPEIEGVRVAYKYIPMMGVGGDFVNIYHRSGDDRIGLFICDVSGHGVYAAMIASMVSNSLDFFWEKHFETPSVILREISSFLKGKMGGYFFTGCICSIDLKTGIVTMSNAGHPPLMLLKRDGTAELKATKGRLISDFFEPNQEDYTFKLESGDSIMLYTDGITEAENSDRKFIGSEDVKFCEWIKKYYEMSSSPDELCEYIYKGVVEHTGTDQLEDDFAVLILEYKCRI